MNQSIQTPGAGVGTGFATRRNQGGNDNQSSSVAGKANQAGQFVKDPLNYLGNSASAPFQDAAKGFMDGFGGAGAAGAGGAAAGMW